MRSILVHADSDAASEGRLQVALDCARRFEGHVSLLIATPLRLISPTSPTFPSRAPRRLLDVIFASPGITALAHPAIGLDAEDLIAASDHRPVWVDIRTDRDPQT